MGISLPCRVFDERDLSADLLRTNGIRIESARIEVQYLKSHILVFTHPLFITFDCDLMAVILSQCRR